MEKSSFWSTQFWLNSFRYASKHKYLDQISADIYFSFVSFHLYLTTQCSAGGQGFLGKHQTVGMDIHPRLENSTLDPKSILSSSRLVTLKLLLIDNTYIFCDSCLAQANYVIFIFLSVSYLFTNKESNYLKTVLFQAKPKI